MRATMEDIAREAGVSMMTVSRVFSGHSRVSAATRQKVLETARRRNYEVNARAQSFAQQRSGFVGVAAPLRLVGTHYFGEIMRGFESVFQGTAWDYAFFNTDSPSFEDGDRLLKLFRSQRVDGLLVVAPNVDDEFLDTFASYRFPFVVVGKEVKSSQACWVGCDDYRGVELACEHLFAQGHRRIAYVGGPAGFSVAQRREQAYLDFCRRERLEVPGWFVQNGDYSLRSGQEAGLALRLRSADRPTAVVAANDAMALGVMESARQARLRVPDDLSVTGFDDIPLAAECFPALTTVYQPVREMAARGAQLLEMALTKDRPPKGGEVLPVSLVPRASTAALS